MVTQEQRQQFRQRLKDLQSYREQNPGMGYVEWKQSFQDGGISGLLKYNGPMYYELKEDIRKQHPEIYNRMEQIYASEKRPTSEIITWKDANGDIRQTPRVIDMSGTDPIGQLYVESVVANPIFKGLGKVAQYGLAKAGNKWARAKILSREMQNISTPNKTIPNNVGWAPKQTIQVNHASDKSTLPIYLRQVNT